MSTVEKTKPDTACPSVSGATCIRKTRSSSGESQGNSQRTTGCCPVRSSSMARSTSVREARSRSASQMELPSTACSSAMAGAPLSTAKRDQLRLALVMRPSRSTV